MVRMMRLLDMHILGPCLSLELTNARPHHLL